MNKEEFIKELEKLKINYNEEQIKKLDIYKDFLIEYNSHTNLTAIKTEEGIYLKHFYDSLTINEHLEENLKILDIGTGAGFPGMVLALFHPNCQLVLLDANNKKIKFLRELQEKLKLKNVTLINERAEEFVRKNFENFDIVTSRAVADLRILSELSLPALKVGGLFLPMKANIETELETSKETIEILGGKINAIKKMELPKEKSIRTILIIEHIKHTDGKYPRVYDKILKKPLSKAK